MTSVLKTDSTHKNFDKKLILSGDEIIYLYELEGRCEKIDLIEKFKNDRETVQGLKENNPVLIYFHETGEVIDGLVSSTYCLKVEYSAIITVRYTGTPYKDAKWGALKKNNKYLDMIMNVDPMNNFGILFLTNLNKEFSIISLI